MSERKVIIPDGMQENYDKMRYAPAVLVDNVLYVSGQVGRDENKQLVEDKRGQFVQTFENIKRILDAAGASFDDIVDVSTFHTDMRDLPLYMEVRDAYITSSDFYPTWTATGAHMIGHQPGCFIEVKVIAHLR
ncbi:MAG TPA: RidA family protein [Propionibacterium sp.]|jgi:enamine deaminase RidA (YjgF/YER057c/UK114 family)|nr:RidA family protein [Propionibacterium sp.]